MKKTKLFLLAFLTLLFSSCVTGSGTQGISKTAAGAAIGGAVGAITGANAGKGGSKRARNTAIGGAVIGGGLGAILDGQEQQQNK